MTATASESSAPRRDPKRSKWVANVTKFIVSTPSSGRSEFRVESGRERISASSKCVSECENSKRHRLSCVSKSGSTKPNSKTSSTASTTTKSQRHEIVIVTCAPCVTTSEQTSSRDVRRCTRKRNAHRPVSFQKPRYFPPCSCSEEDSSQQFNPPRHRSRRHEKQHRTSCTPISSSRASSPLTPSSKRPDDTTQATSSCWSLSHTLSTKSIWNECQDSRSTLHDDICPLSRASFPTKGKPGRLSTVLESEVKNAPKSPDEVKPPPDPPLGLARPASPATDGHFVTCFPQYDECPRNAPLPPWLDPNYQETEPESETETVIANESKSEETPEVQVPKTSPPEYNPWHEMADSKTPYANLPTWDDDFPGGLPYDQCHMEFPTDESQFI